jgi:ADP-ribosylglycohydrolase
MLGTIAGDIIGSVFEHHPHKSVEFPLFTSRSRFTDDTVLTVATAHALLSGDSYADAYHRFGNLYPRAGYGGSFRRWLANADKLPYSSWGNGSAMRVSPIGLAAASADWALDEAERSAMVTHGHPEGIKGAQAVALAVFLAKTGVPREDIRREVAAQSGYDLSRTVADIRESYRLRRLLRRLRARGHHRVPGCGRHRARHSIGRLAWRRRGYAGGDRRRHRGGVLGAAAGADRAPSGAGTRRGSPVRDCGVPAALPQPPP